MAALSRCGRNDLDAMAARLGALGAYRSTSPYSDSDDDLSSDGYESDDSLGDIYSEIAELQQVVSMKRAAAAAQQMPPPNNYSLFAGNQQNDVLSNVIHNQDDSQIVVLKNLSNAKPNSTAGCIDALVIPDEYDLQYDSGGFPFVVPHREQTMKANVISSSNSAVEVNAVIAIGETAKLNFDQPDVPICPQHGPADQPVCPQHGMVGQPVCPQHDVQCAVHNVQNVAYAQPAVQHVLVKKRRRKGKKGKTLFEKLIA